MMLSSRGLTGPEVSLIVDIHAIRNGTKTPLLAELLHDVEKLVFAMKTAGCVIASIFGTIQFRSLDHLQRNLFFFGKRECIRQLRASQAGRVGDYGQHLCSQFLVCRPSQEGRIDTPGVRNQNTAERRNMASKRGLPRCELRRNRHFAMVIRAEGFEHGVPKLSPVVGHPQAASNVCTNSSHSSCSLARDGLRLALRYQ